MTQKTYRARRLKNAVTRHLGDEVVIYDTEADRCHALNPAAAVAWQRCDDRAATLDEISDAIASGTDLPRDPEVACLALEELKKAGLLDGDPAIPAPVGQLSRRQMLTRMGTLAASLPVVASMLAPSPAMAASGDPEPEPTRRPTTRA